MQFKNSLDKLIWYRLLLPSDLFIFDINLNWKKDIESFIEFLDNVETAKGYYFNSNFMNEQIIIKYIYLNSSLTNHLYHYSEQMQSIKVISCSDSDSKQMLETTMLNTVVLSKYSIANTHNRKHVPLHFDPTNDYQVLRSFEPFKKVGYVFMSELPEDEWLRILELNIKI